MEAKDTVMTSRDAVFDPIQEQIQKLLIVQAEISFRAGEQRGLDKLIRDSLAYAQSGELDKRVQEIKKAGIKEVVEWIERVPLVDTLPEGNMKHYAVSIEQWQAKLKEW